MLRKICFALLLVFSTFGGNIGAVVLDVDQIQQEMTNWCWAATSQSVLRYYGFGFSQTQIAAYGTDGANDWNWLYGSSENPTRRGIDMILYNFGGLQTLSFDRSFSFAESESDINNSKPLFVRWGWNTGGGHFVVLKGLEDNNAYLMDPWYGATINTYPWVLSGSGHTWTHSLQMLTSPVANDDVVEISNTLRCYPNPFSQSVKIEFTGTGKLPSNVHIYNLKGQNVKQLAAVISVGGKSELRWDGTDSQGNKVAPGIYLAKVDTGTTILCTKLILMH
ncbi:MAG: hypothetical protein CVU48_06555 [Candidatus Cloacimonetes bacterium HGW-Cloacimonetes-1]|jgi:hypothetical protein|nr:MAG: hypothetical protein CVU48_06555 [Candidatus Cloacimonetes bacterium HGW-Cloacimonetes-1]